jgi:hypothetical protein
LFLLFEARAVPAPEAPTIEVSNPRLNDTLTATSPGACCRT